MKLGALLTGLQRLERELAATYRTVGARPVCDADIFYQCQTFALHATDGGGRSPRLRRIALTALPGWEMSSPGCAHTPAPSLQPRRASPNVATGDGGGIYYSVHGLGELRVTDSTVVSNSAGGNGGGIFNALGSSTLIQNSTVSANRASNGGGIYNDQAANLALQPGASVLRNTATVAGVAFSTTRGPCRSPQACRSC